MCMFISFFGLYVMHTKLLAVMKRDGVPTSAVLLLEEL